MTFKSEAFCFIVLWVIVISAGDLEISNIPSNGKTNPVHREKKISKRHNEPDFQRCLDNFEIHQDKIIRTQDSRAMGARYINERDVPSREDCLRLCCETSDCDVFVFEERSPGSCYLFQCGTPEEFKCKFTKHRNYTSGVLAMNRHMTELESQIKLTKHEHELTNLRQTDSSPTSIIPLSNTVSTSFSDNKETEQLVPLAQTNNSANNNRHCSRYQFECRSSEECIAIYNACDGIPQCSDGSDEAPELGCPALLTTITPADKVSQGEIPESMGMHKVTSDSSSQSIPSSKQQMHQQIPIDTQQQSRHGNKEYNLDSWMKQSASFGTNEQPQLQQHRHHQELKLELQNQQLHQQQLQEHEQQQRLRQQEIQHQRQLQENQQQKLQQIQPQQERQQVQQTQLQQRVTSGENYDQNINGMQSQQMLTMSSRLPQLQQKQLQQTQTQQTVQQQPQQLDNIQPPQQLINQAKLYGREGEGLLYHSPSAVDSLHWSPNSNNYQPEQTQENLSFHSPNSGMSQIFNHKGNSLVSQSERTGNQFVDNLPNEYNRYSNYFDNSQYSRILPHTQQNTWQNAHKPMHEISPLDDSISGPHEGESAISPGLNGAAPDYYYEESMRNKLQQQLLAQQRLLPQSNVQITNEEQLLQTQYKDVKSPTHEEITLDHVNQELPSTGLGASVKKASAHHPSSALITTEKPKETKSQNHGHNSHRKMEQLTAEVTLRETNFDGITMQEAGSPSGAILSLTLGMCVTAVMIVLVGCRMRTVRRRMRRGGKSAYAHDADFLVNGMYL